MWDLPCILCVLLLNVKLLAKNETTKPEVVNASDEMAPYELEESYAEQKWVSESGDYRQGFTAEFSFELRKKSMLEDRKRSFVVTEDTALLSVDD